MRAFALGTGCLLATGEARDLWHRLTLICDVGDTVMGTAMMARRTLTGRFARLVMLTSTPAAVRDVLALGKVTAV